MPRLLAPRDPSGYDSRIHGRADYGVRQDGETDDECDARERIWSAIGNAPGRIKESYLRMINPRATTALVAIYQHGERSYAVGDALPVQVSYEEDKLLTAFATHRRPMSRKELETKHGISNAPRAVTRLVNRYGGVFANTIRRPRVKCNGGYFVKVQPAG